MNDPELGLIRSWNEVFGAIEKISTNPQVHISLIKALTVNLRAETGSLPGYRGAGFAGKADSIDVSKQMREKLEALMSIDLSSDHVYLLVRQLVKSLPYFGASQDEIRAIRGLAEDIEYTFPCPITEDIREETHSKLSPRNLDLVRGLINYVERNDAELLKEINKYQKVIQYRPDRFSIILNLLKDLESELANVFEPHPGRIEDRIENIYQILGNISQIVSPQINTHLRYLLESIEKQNKALIQTNLEVLFSLLKESIETAENPKFRELYENLSRALRGAEAKGPEDILFLITQWRRDVMSLFFPSLVDSLERFIDYLRESDALHAALVLGDLRMSLRHRIEDPLLQSHAMAVTLEAIWLDLTLERIGYILFGEVNNVILANITTETLPVAIDVMRSMILNVRAKGQGTRMLEESANKLLALKGSGKLNLYTAYSVVERINAEIGVITDKMVDTYYDITRDVFISRQLPNAEQAASAFVDGLFRETTLQHLSELTLRLLNFSRTRVADLMKRVRHPPIREISPKKIARINRDMSALQAMKNSSKLAYFFRPGYAEGSMEHHPFLGEKGAYLMEMAKLGMRVPPGFTLSSRVCHAFFADGHVLSDTMRDMLFENLAKLEEITGHRFGSPERPLLLAVRAGSCVSMPGMMDTILNVGLNNETVEGLGRITKNPVFAYECYLRLISKYSSSIMGLTDAAHAVNLEPEPVGGTPDGMRRMVEKVLASVSEKTGAQFPQDPHEQLTGALAAIFSSWFSDSATTYRQIFNIPDHFETAATIQQMVFGNRGRASCSGVVFSRNPITGERSIFGEYLPRSQGEMLVSGRGTPLPLNAGQDRLATSLSLEVRFPEIYKELEHAARLLERHLRDMQDIEFTVEENTLYLLQTRSAKRTDHAALKIAIDLVHEGIIDNRTAVARLREAELKQLLMPVFSPSEAKQLLAKGNPASPGVAVGKVAFDRDEATMRAQAGEEIILVSNRTVPEDIGGIAAAKGVLTCEGGMTSHAAINSRRMGKPCVTGCQALIVNKEKKIVRVDSHELNPEDFISIDGYTGEVFLGAVAIMEPEYLLADSGKPVSELEQYINTYLEWSQEFPDDI